MSPEPASSPLIELFDAATMRRLERLRIRSRQLFAGSARGERRSTRRGSSVEFADFRQYHPGDDFRYIDWHACARHDQLFVKLFVEEQDLHVYLLLDTSSSMGYGAPPKLDHARRLAASLAYLTLSNLDRVSLIGYAERARQTMPPARGRGRIFGILDALGGLAADGRTSLDRSVHELLSRRPKPGVVVVLSDFLDPAGYERPLARLKFEGFEPMAIQVLSPEELSPTLKGDLRLVDAETGAAVDVSINARALRQYQLRLTELLEGLETFCKKHGMPFLRTSSGDAFETLILRYLRQAQLVE